jgi:hypothetical protein
MEHVHQVHAPARAHALHSTPGESLNRIAFVATIMLAIPGAMDAPVLSLHYWASMAVALAVAGVAAFPVNRWLIARGRGHAVVHAHP